MKSPIVNTSSRDRPLGEKLVILSNPYRRRILSALDTATPRGRKEFVSEIILNNGEDLAELNLLLYHTHLPKLDESGYIDWDREADTITRGANSEAIVHLRELMDEHDGDAA